MRLSKLSLLCFCAAFVLLTLITATPLAASDPTLIYSLRLGGSGGRSGLYTTAWDSASAMAVAPDGTVWIAGTAWSPDFPQVNALSLAAPRFLFSTSFLARVSADGSALLYSTFFPSRIQAIAVDRQGKVYVAGSSTGDLTATPGVVQPVYARNPQTSYATTNGFIAKLSADGAKIEYATYLGGTADNWISAVAVDADGSAFVTGGTASDDFPVTVHDGTPAQFCGACYHGFVAELSSDASRLVYSRYIADAAASALALDAGRNAYVTGGVSGAGFPLTAGVVQPFLAGHQDAFIAKIDENGSLVYSTAIGGAADDGATSIAVDSSGNAWIAGQTTSGNFPTTSGGVQRRLNGMGACLTGGRGDAFITKLDATGSHILYSTYLGGSSCDSVNAIQLGADGNVVLAGTTGSTDFPLVNAVQNGMLAGSFTLSTDHGSTQTGQLTDAFMVTLAGDGSSLIYSTYAGSSAADMGRSVALDSHGNAYLLANMSEPSDFPVFHSPLAAGTISLVKVSGRGIPPLFTRDGVANADAHTRGLVAGSTAVIRGTHLTNVTGSVDGGGALEVAGVSVTFGGKPAAIVSLLNATDSEEIRFLVPADAADGSVVVNNNGAAGMASGVANGVLLTTTGSGQTGVAETQLAEQLVITASDGDGRDLGDYIHAEWSVAAGGGTLADPGNTGTRKSWTLGFPGPQVVTASVKTNFGAWPGTIGVVFTATATNGSGAVAAFPQDGIVNGAGYDLSPAALSPGMFASLFGTGLSTSTTGVLGSGGTLVAGTRVIVNGIAAPLYFVSERQINFQAPWEIQGQTSVSVRVSVNGTLSNTVTLPVVAASPGIFTSQQDGRGPAAALNQDNTINSAGNPAARGSVMQMFGTGLGPVTWLPACLGGDCSQGLEQAPPGSLSYSMELPAVAVDGLPASVEFSGLAPAWQALWQVNVRVPDNASTGEVPLLLSTGGQQANPVTIFVK